MLAFSQVSHTQSSRHASAKTSSPVLYIFFKIYLKSKVIPTLQIDFATEFALIASERAAAGSEEKGKKWYQRIIHSV